MGSFFSIGTFHTSVLIAVKSTGVVANGVLGSPGTIPVYAYVAHPGALVAYLGCALPRDTPPTIRPLEAVGGLIPVRMTLPALDGSVAFFSPWTGRFLVAVPPDPAIGIGHVLFDAPEPNEYEKLYLRDVDERDVPPDFKLATQLLQEVTSSLPTTDLLLRILQRSESGIVSADVLNSVGLLLSPRDMIAFAERVSASEDSVAKLREIFPADFAAKHAIGSLIEWRMARRSEQQSPTVHHSKRLGRAAILSQFFRRSGKPLGERERLEPLPAPTKAVPTVTVIGPEFDLLDRIGIRGSYVSLPHACNIVLRRQVRSSRLSCVLATACNEGLYLLEWLAHHRAMGFEGFFIYSNGNTDGSDDLLLALAKAGEINWVKNIVGQGCRPQWKAYGHALQIDPRILDFEWTLVIDLDEYFSLNSEFFADIKEYLDWCERSPVDVLGFNWFVIGSNGETHWRDAPLRRRFPARISAPDAGGYASPLLKSMFRTRKFLTSMPHHPVEFRGENISMRASSMRPLNFDPAEGQGKSITPDWRLAWISHYFFKSNEEFVYKFSRARGDDLVSGAAEFSALTSQFITGFVESSERSAFEDTNVDLDRQTQAHMERYLRIPEVSRANAAIRMFYSKRLDSLLPKLASSRSMLDAGIAGQTFLRPLLSRSR
jgi:hypothetical protein